jgi:hypothetical protein
MSKKRKSPERMDQLEGKKNEKSRFSDTNTDIIRIVASEAAKKSDDKWKTLRERDPSKQVKAAIEAAKKSDDKWETLREPEIVQISPKKWNVIQHQKSLPQQLRRTDVITVKRNSLDSYEVVSTETYEADLATAELCEEKLKGFRLNHYIRFTDKATSLVKEYQKELDKLDESGDSTKSEKKKADLTAKYEKNIAEAREKYDKAIKALDDIYKNQKLDNQTLSDLEQMEAKEANKNDLDRRTKNVESKIAKIPEELSKNAQSIRKKLDKIHTLMQEIDQSINRPPKTDKRTGAQIINDLGNSLAKDNITPDVFSSISELNRRFQHSSSLSPHDEASQNTMEKLHTALLETHHLFKKREISLDERQALLLKYERYTRSQDAETMLYNNRLLANRAKIEAARSRLAAALDKEARCTIEADRIYRVLKVGGKPRPPISASTDAPPPSLLEETPSGLYTEAQQKLEQAHLNVLYITQELAVAEEHEKTLQKQVELAKSRHDTNEEREKIKRNTIIEFDKLGVQNKREMYKELVNNQRKLEIMEINTLLLRIHTRNMFRAAALAAYMPAFPNTMQRETTNQWSAFQSMLRNW